MQRGRRVLGELEQPALDAGEAVFQTEICLLYTSTGSNPVVIRNLFGALQKAGILSVARGTGGAVLLRSPEEITVWDVYAALESDEKHELL